jgi:CDP-diacylglycerol--inositol 3-phosphatidyltransferase
MATLLTKHLSEIVYFIPNLITGFRLVLNYCALFLFDGFPQLSCFLLMTSVILDYFDGYAARKYNQCSFFGDTFDWVVDISSSAAVYFWWATLEPRLIFAIFTLLTLEIISMVVDIIAKSHGYTPMVRNDNLLTLVLKYTMKCDRRGASYVGLGYWNEILHYLCVVSRVLFLTTAWAPWNFLFYATLPASLSYVWMNLAYAKNISDR